MKVRFIDHPRYQPQNRALIGEVGEIVGWTSVGVDSAAYYLVKIPWWAKPFICIPEILESLDA